MSCIRYLDDPIEESKWRGYFDPTGHYELIQENHINNFSLVHKTIRMLLIGSQT